MKYLVLIEPGQTSWDAHVSDLPGYVAVGESRDEVVGLVREPIAFHLEGFREQGELVPGPRIQSKLVESSVL
jgi:predicted RNase H-like HicB family nuclease